MTATETARNELIDACVADCRARIGGVLIDAMFYLECKLDRLKIEVPAESAAMKERSDHQPELFNGIELARTIVQKMFLVSDAVDRRIGSTGLGEPCECPFDREQLEHDVNQQLMAWFSRI